MDYQLCRAFKTASVVESAIVHLVSGNDIGLIQSSRKAGWQHFPIYKDGAEPAFVSPTTNAVYVAVKTEEMLDVENPYTVNALAHLRYLQADPPTSAFEEALYIYYDYLRETGYVSQDEVLEHLPSGASVRPLRVAHQYLDQCVSRTEKMLAETLNANTEEQAYASVYLEKLTIEAIADMVQEEDRLSDFQMVPWIWGFSYFLSESSLIGTSLMHTQVPTKSPLERLLRHVLQ